MPIRKLLEGSAFTPEQTRELIRIYHEVVTALSLKSPTDQEDAAQTILLIASQRGFDPGRSKIKP